MFDLASEKLKKLKQCLLILCLVLTLLILSKHNVILDQLNKFINI